MRFSKYRRDGLAKKIEELQAQLASLDKGTGGTSWTSSRHPIPAALTTFALTVKAVALAVFSTVFATSASGSLHRSAMFLLVFLVVHMVATPRCALRCHRLRGCDAAFAVHFHRLCGCDAALSSRYQAGNLTALFGRDAYNSYGHHLNTTPGIKIVELYLAAGFFVHLYTAAKFTTSKRKAVAKKPLTIGLLALSGTVLLVFLVLHLWAFRFSPSTRRWRHTDSPPDAPTDRDLYFLMFELFSHPGQVAFYVAAIVAVGFHLHKVRHCLSPDLLTAFPRTFSLPFPGPSHCPSTAFP